MNLKYWAFLLLLLTASLSVAAQFSTQKQAYNFSAPGPADIKSMCDCIAAKEKPSGDQRNNFSWAYEIRMLQMAGIKLEDARNDSSIEKIKLYWNKYKTSFTCQSSGFDIDGGNILKFALVQNFIPFLTDIVVDWDLDISFKDPADGRNLGEYINENLFDMIGSQGLNHPRVKVLKNYIDEIGGYTSSCQFGLLSENSNWAIGGKVKYLSLYTEGFDKKVQIQKGGHEAEILTYNADFTKFKLKITKVVSSADMPKGTILTEGTEVWLPIEGWGTASEYKK